MNNQTTSNNQIKMLSDISMEGVSGGTELDATDIAAIASLVAMGTSILGGTGCAVANAVINSKATKAMHEGKKDQWEKYNKAAKNLAIAGASFGGLGIVGGIGLVGSFIAG